MEEAGLIEVEALDHLPPEHQMYRVVSYLGSKDGFGEKGRLLNSYL